MILHKKLILQVVLFICFGVTNLFGQTIIPSLQNTPNATNQMPITVPSPYPSSNFTVNFVRTWTATAPFNNSNDVISSARSVNEVKQNTQYYDGLGRPLQSVEKQISPNQNDVVTTNVYDEYNREVYKYLPYTSPSATGKFKIDPFNEQATVLKSIYNPNNLSQGERFFYSKTIFEASPLSRVEKNFSSGNSWVGTENSTTSHGNVFNNLFNTVSDDVKIWDVKSGVDKTVTLLDNGNGTQRITYTWFTIPSNANTLLFSYRNIGATSWNIATVGGATSNYVSYDIPTGNYEYAVQTFFSDGTASTITNFTVTGTGDKTISSSGIYGDGQLYKTILINENGHYNIEYKDNEGKVILKKVQIDDDVTNKQAHIGWLSTYYIYDDYGLLIYVLQPKLVESTIANNPLQFTELTAGELIFAYKYDTENRMIAKKVPGSGWVYMVYDKRDRLTYTQDANMRTKNQWLTVLYDQLNRPKTTGMITYSGSRQDLQDLVNTAFAAATATDITTTFAAPPDLYVDIRENGLLTYRAINTITINNEFTSETGAEFETILGAGSNTATTILTSSYNPFPTGANFIALTVTYYDEYPSNNTKVYTTTNNGKLDDGGNANADALPANASVLTKGMATMTKVRVLADPNDLTKGQWLETVTYYDNKGRAIQSQSDNAKSGVDISTMRYDFSGKVLTTYQVHRNPAASITVSTKTNMVYDHAGRVLSISKTLNDNTATTRLIARNTYDELGQLVTKKLGQKSVSDVTELEALDYSYNIRGWLQGINKAYANTNTPGNTTKWFGMQLSYDYGFTQSQFNGNIAGTIWKTRGSDEQRAYGYAYDAANRLLKGDFTQNNGGWNQTAGLNYNMQMGNSNTPAYDANGNILAMTQYGFKIGGNVATPIDNLTYTYNANSNKLKNVIDANNDANTTLGDFRSSQTYMNALGTKTANATDYTYDANGNMQNDLNKDIGTIPLLGGGGAGITYNHLNLPYQITVTGKGTITYTYDAAGNKLRKTTVDNTVSPTKTTISDYLGGGVYENDVLQFIGHEEGRYRPITPTTANGNASWAADYFIKDHLGNVRMVLTDELKQDVYPAATLEGDIANSGSAAYVENQYYSINSNAIVNNPASLPNTYANNNGNPPYNNNPNSNTTATSAKMYKLNGQSGDKIGLGITLKVMAGDNIDIRGKSFWHNNGTIANNYPITNNILDFLTAFAGTSAVSSASHSGVTGTLLNNTPTTTSGLNSWLSNVPSPANKPKAYINWVLFDEQFKPVTTGGGSGFDGVDIADQIKSHVNNVNITKNGFLYVYCSNESNQDVFFDNLQVTHTKGPLVEETHYYPFGLTMVGISSKAAGGLENRFKHIGQELQNKEFSDGSGLEKYDFGARFYDSQIGKWHVIDPRSDNMRMASPYNYNLNNPVNLVDLNGEWAIYWHFIFTRNTFKSFGYSESFSSRLAHYSSIYADNPAGYNGSTYVSPKHKWLVGANRRLAITHGVNSSVAYEWLRYRNDVNYSGTQNSQSETDPASQLMHGTRSVAQAANGRTAMESVLETQQLAWGKVFDVAHKNLGENLGDKEFEQLGSAIHGLQDAERHKGAIYSSGDGNEHSLMGDMFGPPMSSKEVTSTVALVYGMLQGDFSQVGDGKYLFVPGMNTQQLGEVMMGALNNGYNASYDGNTKKLTLTRK